MHKKSECVMPGDFFLIQIKICYCFYPVEISVLIFLNTVALPYTNSGGFAFHGQLPVVNHSPEVEDPPSNVLSKGQQ